jgi:hypothetical protein
MRILFSNGKTVDIVLDSSPLASTYQTIYKHLQHVTIPFREWDNPFNFKNRTHQELVEALIFYGNKVSIQIDHDLGMQQDQDYFNTLHKIYEKNYNGDTNWLDFHEHIHACEKNKSNKKVLYIDYREKSGMIEKPFVSEWMQNATTKIKKGDVFVYWSELGKTPYGYWKNNEPIDVVRMCELIKPWLKLRPKILVALEDIDMLDNIEVDKFESWWPQYSEVLCQHWDRPAWTTHDIFAVSVFGQVPMVQDIIQNLKNNAKPIKVQL